MKGKKLCASASSVREKKDIFTAETAESAEKRLNGMSHGCTRTGQIKERKRGGWEVRKMGSEWKLKAIRAERSKVKDERKKTLCLGELCER